MSEGDGSLKLCAILVRGIPTKLAKFTLTTVDGGAAGMLDLNLLSSFLHVHVVMCICLSF